MTDFDLENIISNMIEGPPTLFQPDDKDYISLGISIKLEKSILVNKNDIYALMTFVKKHLTLLHSCLTDNFLYKTISSYLMKIYDDKSEKKDINDLLEILNNLTYKKTNIYVKIFNLQTDIEEYDFGSFVLYDPQYFIKKNKNLLMYHGINDKSSANSDNIIHTGLVFKDIETFLEDKDLLNYIIQEKIREFINFISVALGDKYNAQKLNSNFNHISMEYHLLDDDMHERSSSFSSEGSTFTKGNVILNTNLFFNNHNRFFKLFSKRDNQLKEKLYKSILWLGKSLQTENISDSFLQVTIALECILARNEKGYFISPGIAYTLSEVLAFLVTDNREARIKIFMELKKLYGLRSSIVHSGKSNITFQQYNDFFQIVKIGIYSIIDLMEEHKFNNINDVYDYIDRIKFQ